jgi:hypothetical protein
VWNGSYNDRICSIIYANGQWVVGGLYYNGYSYTARLAYATDLAGTWATKDLWSSSGECCINGIVYADGYFVAGGTSMASDGSNYYAYIAYTTNLTGSWTTKHLWNCKNNCGINCITYVDGYWVAGGAYYSNQTSYSQIAYTTNPAGTWKTKELWNSSNTNDSIKCIAYANGYWVAGGQCGGSSNYGRIAYKDASTFYLPTITVDAAYAYIKAKED